MSIDLLKECVMGRCSEEAPENIIKILECNNISYRNKEKEYIQICNQVKKIYNSVDWSVDEYGNYSQSAISYVALIQAIAGIVKCNEFHYLISTL